MRLFVNFGLKKYKLTNYYIHHESVIRKLVMQEYRKQKVWLPELGIPRSTSWGKSIGIHFLLLKYNVITFCYVWVPRYFFSTDFSNSELSYLLFHSKFVWTLKMRKLLMIISITRQNSQSCVSLFSITPNHLYRNSTANVEISIAHTKYFDSQTITNVIFVLLFLISFSLPYAY